MLTTGKAPCVIMGMAGSVLSNGFIFNPKHEVLCVGGKTNGQIESNQSQIITRFMLVRAIFFFGGNHHARI